MTSKTTLHATLVFEREVPAPVEDVFAAVADPIARTEWGAPTEGPFSTCESLRVAAGC